MLVLFECLPTTLHNVDNLHLHFLSINIPLLYLNSVLIKDLRNNLLQIDKDRDIGIVRYKKTNWISCFRRRTV